MNPEGRDCRYMLPDFVCDSGAHTISTVWIRFFRQLNTGHSGYCFSAEVVTMQVEGRQPLVHSARDPAR